MRVDPRPGGRHLALVGPTASGKSALALELARRHPDLEIVSVDSMQVYRGMDVGTAKPTPAERRAVPHHLLDVADPDEDYTVARYQRDCLAVLADVEASGSARPARRGDGAVPAGRRRRPRDPGAVPRAAGTPRRRARHRGAPPPPGGARPGGRRPHGRHQPPADRAGPGGHPRQRPTVLLLRARAWTPTRHRRSPSSASTSSGPSSTSASPPATAGRWLTGSSGRWRRWPAGRAGCRAPARQALGYAELLDHVERGTPLDDALDTAVTRTRRFARRQQRWFGRDPRIRWVGPDNAVEVLDRMLGD